MFARWLKRHPKADELFSGLDQYYPNWAGIDYALNYCCEMLKILKCDAYNCERYRQQVCRMKILLMQSGMAPEAVEASDWSDNTFGVNCLSALVKENIGQIVIEQVKAGASPEGIRQVIIDQIFVKSV